MASPLGRLSTKKITAPEQYAEKIARIPYGFFRDQQCIYWKKETGCDVDVSFDGRKRVFHLYGSKESVDKATRAINKWLESASTKSIPSSTWAKSSAFDYNKWYYDEVTMLENERKQEFLGPPPDGEMPHRVAVPWPEELLQQYITPRDSFGNKLEGLRDLRTTHEVYISLLPTCEVEIKGYYEDGVDAAAARYRNLTEHVLHQTRNQSLKVNVILDVPEGSESQVLIKHAESWWPTPGVVPQLLLSPMDDDELASKPQVPSPTSMSDLRDAIETALEAIRREPGCYEFAIRYGLLCLDNLTEKTALGEAKPVSAFKKAIEGRVLCNIKRWYAPYDKGILQPLFNCDDLLEPTRSGSGFFGRAPSSLSDTLPSYRAFFIFGDPYQSSCNMVMKIEWLEDEDEDMGYRKQPVSFYRLKKPNALAPTEKMAANLLELTRSKGWHFSLEAMAAYPKSQVSPSIRSFAEEVKLVPEAIRDLNSRSVFVTCPKGPKVPQPKRSRLERTYTFRLRDTAYKVDATTTWYAVPEQKQQYVPLSGLSVRHEDWSSHLSHLETMAPGGDPGWAPPEHILDSFVPEMDLLIERLLRLSEMLYSPDNQQLPSLGVRLGQSKLVDI